jgi:hypothetical protein
MRKVFALFYMCLIGFLFWGKLAAQIQPQQPQFQSYSPLPSPYTPQANGSIPTGQPNTQIYNSQPQQQQQNAAIENEVSNKRTANYNEEYWKSPDFIKAAQPFYDAFNSLKDQLTGKTPISVKDAYYAIESAYGNVFLTKKEYDAQIEQSVAFVRQWMAEHKLNPNDNISKHLALQKFICDTLKIGNVPLHSDLPQKKEIHYPFYYDYQDYKGEKDYRSQFVTKTLATGNGQCHTLPLVYAILAESIGAKFYLSLAPIHSFIKYPDNEGNIHNFEPTTNWQISDQWYKDWLFIKSRAEQTQLYLNKLTREQIVAQAMIDLAAEYKEKLGIADGAFINQCVDFAINYFPNKDASVDCWLLRSEVDRRLLNRLAHKYNVTSYIQGDKIPEIKKLEDKLGFIDDKLEDLGYTEIPKSAYDFMVESQDNKGTIQRLKKMNDLQKRSSFVSSNP